MEEPEEKEHDFRALVYAIGGRQAAADALHINVRSVDNWFTQGVGNRQPQWALLELLRMKTKKKLVIE